MAINSAFLFVSMVCGSPVVEDQVLFISTSLQKMVLHILKQKSKHRIGTKDQFKKEQCGIFLAADTSLGLASLRYLSTSLKLSPHGISSPGSLERALCLPPSKSEDG